MEFPWPEAAFARSKAEGFSSTSTTSNAIFRSPSPFSSDLQALHHLAPYTVTADELSEETPAAVASRGSPKSVPEIASEAARQATIARRRLTSEA